jgi:hypothetical protein
MSRPEFAWCNAVRSVTPVGHLHLEGNDVLWRGDHPHPERLGGHLLSPRRDSEEQTLLHRPYVVGDTRCHRYRSPRSCPSGDHPHAPTCTDGRDRVELRTKRAVNTSGFCGLRSPLRKMVAARRGIGAIQLQRQRRGTAGVAAQDPPVGRGIAADVGLHEQPLARGTACQLKMLMEGEGNQPAGRAD